MFSIFDTKYLSHLIFCCAVIVIAITSFVSIDAIAESGDHILAEESEDDICSRGGQSEMNICMTLEYKKTNQSMNDIYSQLVLALKFPEGVENSQQAWIRYRDAECSNDIFQLSKPNSLSPLVEASCKRTLTLERIKRLEMELKQNCNGCPLRK